MLGSGKTFLSDDDVPISVHRALPASPSSLLQVKIQNRAKSVLNNPNRNLNITVTSYSKYYPRFFSGVLRAEQLISVCVCVVIPFILNVRLVDAPAGVTQDFSTYLLRCLPYFFIARRIQPSLLSLVDREVEFCVPTN